MYREAGDPYEVQAQRQIEKIRMSGKTPFRLPEATPIGAYIEGLKNIDFTSYGLYSPMNDTILYFHHSEKKGATQKIYWVMEGSRSQMVTNEKGEIIAYVI